MGYSRNPFVVRCVSESDNRQDLKSTASLGLTDNYHVDILGLWYRPVTFGAEKTPGPPNRFAQIN